MTQPPYRVTRRVINEIEIWLRIPAVLTAVSASPNSGNGMQQTFNFVYSDSNGIADLATDWFKFDAG